MTLVTGSQIVFFVSLAAHACQFFFLVWFENPHIERTYIKKQPIAARVPLFKQDSQPRSSSTTKPSTPVPTDRRRGDSISTNASTLNASDLPSDDPLSSATSIFSDGEEDIFSGNEDDSRDSFQPRNRSMSQYSESTNHEKMVTRHDLNNRYFHGDTIIFSNFDPFR